MLDPTGRFSSRVDAYVRFRPGYPAELVPLLEGAGTLRPDDRVADLGFGTGKLAERFVERGYALDAVEPNDEMRTAGADLVPSPLCTVHSGRAEATGLAAGSIGLATAAQAFHWFDVDATLAELGRILAPGGRVALIWNVRDEGASPFMSEYEALLDRHGTDYRNVGAHGVDDAVRRRLFGAAGGRFDRLPNRQRLDRAGLLGRVLSASYAPEPGKPGHEAMVEALDALYLRHRKDDAVELLYRTEIYHGEFAR